MREVTWSVNDHGRLIGAKDHDATIIGLDYVAGNQLGLLLRRPSGTRARVVLASVCELTLREFWAGATVLDISVWKASAVPEHLWRSLDDGWNALLAQRIGSAGAGLAADRIGARRPEPLLVVVTGSYGCTFAAVCDGLRVFEDVAVAGSPTR